MTDNSLSVYTDGGARGNPGPAASAYVMYKGDEIVDKHGNHLGIKTNNEAEYQGVIDALNALTRLNLPAKTPITFYSDSLLMVNQLKGVYKIKEPRLASLAQEVRALLKSIDLNHQFVYIPRAQNKLADALVNQTLDMVGITGILEA